MLLILVLKTIFVFTQSETVVARFHPHLPILTGNYLNTAPQQRKIYNQTLAVWYLAVNSVVM